MHEEEICEMNSTSARTVTVITYCLPCALEERINIKNLDSHCGLFTTGPYNRPLDNRAWEQQQQQQQQQHQQQQHKNKNHNLYARINMFEKAWGFVFLEGFVDVLHNAFQIKGREDSL